MRREIDTTDYSGPGPRFKVEWGEASLGFFDVSGLSTEQVVLEYRKGSSREYSAQKMPGIHKFNSITLKRGVVRADSGFHDWLSSLSTNNVERRDLVISLLDEEGASVMVWKAVNAFPVKIEAGAMNVEVDGVAVETIEFSHEGLTIEDK